jgi:Max protein
VFGIPVVINLVQGDKPSRAQILKKASEYIAFMRRKNASHTADIEDLKRQNQHLENQVNILIFPALP